MSLYRRIKGQVPTARGSDLDSGCTRETHESGRHFHIAVCHFLNEAQYPVLLGMFAPLSMSTHYICRLWPSAFLYRIQAQPYKLDFPKALRQAGLLRKAVVRPSGMMKVESAVVGREFGDGRWRGPVAVVPSYQEKEMSPFSLVYTWLTHQRKKVCCGWELEVARVHRASRFLPQTPNHLLCHGSGRTAIWICVRT